MQVVSFPAWQARTHYRHELRTLTYVTLDAANGGIIRNLNSEGVAVQAVAPLRQGQRVRVRFELRVPRLRVDTYGQVSWASSSGQCGVRFTELAPQMARQIDEWIFSSLLELAGHEAARPNSIFGAAVIPIAGEGSGRDENDGLKVSSEARPTIWIETGSSVPDEPRITALREEEFAEAEPYSAGELSWLSRPISARALAWWVDGLVVIAALLLFALIFLSIAHELPEWPLTVAAALVAGVFAGGAYWGLFAVFGGGSLGTRLAASSPEQEDEIYRRYATDKRG
jgi:hypothetical protein